MKTLAGILVVYLSLITAAPALCIAGTALSSIDNCCNSSGSCNKEPEKPSVPDSPCSEGCLVQACHCCFFASEPLRLDHLQRIELPEASPDFDLRDEHPLSSFFSDCWQPPEMA